MSALFLIAYLAQAVVTLTLGRIATLLETAVDIGVATVTVLAAMTWLLDLARKKACRAAHDARPGEAPSQDCA